MIVIGIWVIMIGAVLDRVLDILKAVEKYMKAQTFISTSVRKVPIKIKVEFLVTIVLNICVITTIIVILKDVLSKY